LVEPFLKWAGGKRWLFKRYRHLFPREIDRLVDPFLGGGSSFFYLNPKNAVLSDVNRDIITAYDAVKTNPRGIARRLKSHHSRHSVEYYYRTREKRPQGQYELAAWILYLNRTCWNGLFRVNLNGNFNVPIGTKTAVFTSAIEFLPHSFRLANAELRSCDFERTIAKAKVGDMVFADPPYFENGTPTRFVKYNSNVFSWEDQLRLRETLIAARGRGARVFLTNSNHHSLLSLYSDLGRVYELSRHSVVSGTNKGRKAEHEILVELL
jgi:DNA adenine methylase